MKKERMKILLVDDEQDALDLMYELLKNMNDVEVVGKASDRLEAIELMIHNEPHVIFQDIEMQGVSGLQLVDEYRKHYFAGRVVFVTAHSKYAIEAIKRAAYDYLLKPVDLDELKILILKLYSDHKTQNNASKKLKIPTRTGYVLIAKEDIAICEADGNYTNIIKKDTTRITITAHLGKVEEGLTEPNFFRLSRSIIVNLHFLDSVDKGNRECKVKLLANEYVLPISRKSIGMLEERL
jgi:two-component system, LytTR family, response regulator